MVDDLNIRMLMKGSYKLIRPSLGHYVPTREAFLRRAADIFGWLADQSLKTYRGGVWPLAEVSAAHEALESRQQAGKLLLLIGDRATAQVKTA